MKMNNKSMNKNRIKRIKMTRTFSGYGAGRVDYGVTWG